MVIAMLDVNIKPGREEEFKAWVAESNDIISKFDGFVSRRLLRGSDGSLRMMVEFDSEEQFAAMRSSQEHRSVHRQASEFREDTPAPAIYRVVAG
ncbi:MAG: antibiotic biosynthesis monooxygenase [Nitrosopumilaceae archaeon]|nr:antibiotic biosynthesis monooxygenase [Nitrosopumilaceae archaeon]